MKSPKLDSTTTMKNKSWKKTKTKKKIWRRVYVWNKTTYASTLYVSIYVFDLYIFLFCDVSSGGALFLCSLCRCCVNVEKSTFQLKPFCMWKKAECLRYSPLLCVVCATFFHAVPPRVSETETIISMNNTHTHATSPCIRYSEHNIEWVRSKTDFVSLQLDWELMLNGETRGYWIAGILRDVFDWTNMLLRLSAWHEFQYFSQS